MRLKLYSGGEVTDAFFRDLHALISLSESNLKLLLDRMLKVAKGELTLDEMEKGIAEEIGTNEDDVAPMFRVLFAVALRILSGKSGTDVQDDLVTQAKVPRDIVKVLFSLIERLQSNEKDDLRQWLLFVQLKDFNPHWSSLRWEVQLRHVVDNGHLIGALPYLILQMTVSVPKPQGEELWILEMDADEFKRLLDNFKAAGEEYDSAAKELRKRLGDIVAVRRISD
jgi:hypothetical protein